MKLFIKRAFTLFWLISSVCAAPMFAMQLYGTPVSELSTDALIINVFILVVACFIGGTVTRFAMIDDWDIKKEQ